MRVRVGFAFDRTFTNANPTINNPNSGADLATMLLGTPTSGSTSIQQSFETIFKYYGYYFHDDYRISPNFTINVGLRYEFEQMPSDRNNQYGRRFRPQSG